MHLVLFFTYGMTLKRWERAGILRRESAFYIKLAEKGVKVTFVTYGDAGEYEYQEKLPGITILPLYGYVRRPRSALIRFLNSFHIAETVSEHIEECDVLKTNQLWGGWLALGVKRTLNKPLLLRCGFERYSSELTRNAPFLRRKLTWFISRKLYRSADKILLPSESDAEFVRKKFKIKNEKIVIYPNFIDTDIFYPEEKTEEKKCGRILYVGRLESVKNLNLLIKAAHKAGTGLDIYGKGSQKKELGELAAEIGADVKFFDPLPNTELPEVYRKYGIFVLPSVFEGSPKVILEAMACGLAVIASDIPGSSAIIRNGENGILVSADEKSLSDAIQRVSADCVLRTKLGKNAAETIRKKYSMNRALERELDIINDAAGI